MQTRDTVCIHRLEVAIGLYTPHHTAIDTSVVLAVRVFVPDDARIDVFSLSPTVLPLSPTPVKTDDEAEA